MNIATRALVAFAAIAALTAATTTGCGREVDVSATGAQAVPGVANLYRFCDGPTLVYFTKVSGGNDEYEWFYPGGCTLAGDGKTWVFNDVPPDYSVPNGDSTEDK